MSCMDEPVCEFCHSEPVDTDGVHDHCYFLECALASSCCGEAAACDMRDQANWEASRDQ